MGKGKKVVVVLFVFILLALIGLGAAYAYMTTDLFKTPTQLFKKYFVNNIDQIANFNMAPFDTAVKRMDSEKTEFFIDGSVDTSKFEYADGEGEKYGGRLTVLSDFPNDGINMTVSGSVNDEKIASATLALSEEIFGFKMEELYDKYIALENKNLKKFAENLGMDEEYIEQIPDKIEFDNYEVSQEDIEKVEALRKKYLTKIFDSIEDTQYSSEKNVEVTVGENTLTSSKYTLTTSVEQVATISVSVLKELVEDEEFISLLKNRAEEETIEEMREKVRESIADFEDDIKELDEEDNIEIKVSVYAVKGKVVKTEFEAEESKMSFAIINSDNQSEMYFVVDTPKSEESYTKVGSVNTIAIINKITNDEGNLEISVKEEYNKNDLKELIDGLDEEEDDDDDYGWSSFYDEDYYKEIYKDESFSIKVNSKISDNEITSQISLTGTDEDIAEMNKVLKLKFGFKFGTDVKIVIPDENNAEIVNDYTMDDFEELGQKIMEHFAKYAEENPDSKLIKLISGELDDYDYEDEEDDDDYPSTPIMTPTSPISADEEEEETEDLETIKEKIDEDITTGLDRCLKRYKTELMVNDGANLGDFLTVEAVQDYCGDDYKLSLEDGSTIKCEYDGNTYYAKMEIDGDNLEVIDVKVLEESEY